MQLLNHVQTGIVIVLLSVTLIVGLCIVIKESKRVSNSDDRNQHYEIKFKSLFSNTGSVNKEFVSPTFNFNVFQTNEELKKRNSGADLCQRDFQINYVEYCENVKYN